MIYLLIFLKVLSLPSQINHKQLKLRSVAGQLYCFSPKSLLIYVYAQQALFTNRSEHARCIPAPRVERIPELKTLSTF